jgi:hypothetical protein
MAARQSKMMQDTQRAPRRAGPKVIEAKAVFAPPEARGNHVREGKETAGQNSVKVLAKAMQLLQTLSTASKPLSVVELALRTADQNSHRAGLRRAGQRFSLLFQPRARDPSAGLALS